MQNINNKIILELTNNKYRSVFFLVIIFYLLSIFYEFKEFHLWQQVEYLHSLNFRIRLSNLYSYPHSMRYLLVTPIYYMSDLLNVDYNFIFSILVVVFCTVVSFLFYGIISNIVWVKDKWLLMSVIMIYFSLLTLSMNGRLVFGFLSYSLFFYGYVGIILNKRNLLSILYVISSLFFSSATSGIAISLFLISSVLMAIWFFWINRISKLKIMTVMFFLIFFILYSPIILMLVNKNLNYFGSSITESVVSMTSHGVIAANVDKLNKNSINKNSINKNSINKNSINKNSINKELINKLLWSFFSIFLFYYIFKFKGIFFKNIILLLIVLFMIFILLLSIFANSILMMGFVPFILMVMIVYYGKGRVKKIDI
ncbi:MAG TPA: hypothetical protein ENJ28_02085 [Gammaproteobacteria bacterium]|nr:hypothetical protein [Gammaproteobacteria bacterium]